MTADQRDMLVKLAEYSVLSRTWGNHDAIHAALAEIDRLKSQLAAAGRIIDDRGVVERDCGALLPDRIDALIVEQRSAEYWRLTVERRDAEIERLKAERDALIAMCITTCSVGFEVSAGFALDDVAIVGTIAEARRVVRKAAGLSEERS